MSNKKKNEQQEGIAGMYEGNIKVIVKGKEITAEIPGEPTPKGEVDGNEGWMNFVTDTKAKGGKRSSSPSKS